MHFTTFDGKDIFYETYGDEGDIPVVLVHTTEAEHGMWAPQSASFPAAGLFTVVFDLRGHGQSSEVESVVIDDYVGDLSRLLDRVRLSKANLVGTGLGASIVQQFACDFPQKVDKLVIADSSGVAGAFVKKAAKIDKFLFKNFPRTFLAWGFWLYKLLGATASVKYLKATAAKMDMHQIIIARKVFYQFNPEEQLYKITAPTLVLAGDRDAEQSIGWGKRMVAGIEGARFTILKGGIEPSNLEVPELFDAAVIDFLK